MVNKKASIVLTMLILENEGEYNHPISQGEIVRLLKATGISCDRKTIGRDIAILKQLGLPIKRTSRGFYLEKKRYTKQEVFFVKKCIDNAQDSEIDKEDLFFRLKRTMGHEYAWFGD